MNKVVNDLKKEYSLYSDRDLALLAKRYYNIPADIMSRGEIIDKMVSVELTNGFK